MYEGDTPNAERRAAALSLDRDLLRELLGQEELRELIDPGALERVEDDLQHRSEMTRATGRDGLHDVLRRVGDLTARRSPSACSRASTPPALLAELERERRAIRLRVGGEERYVAADEAGLYRDALGAVPPGGLPEAFLEDVPDALRVLVARYARTHGPFTTEELRARYGVDASAVLRELERGGRDRPRRAAPAGAEREWCDVEVLRRLRRASLAALRKEIEPADQRSPGGFLPSWQGVDRHSGTAPGIDRLREVLVPLQGLALPVEIWERDVLPRRTGAYSQAWLDSLCASGELVWVGAGPLGRSGRVALYFREDAPLIGPPSMPRAGSASAPDAPEHELLRARLAQGPCFFSDLLAELDVPAEALREALWDLVWAGEATNDAWAPCAARSRSRRGGDPRWPQGVPGPASVVHRSGASASGAREPSRRSRAAGVASLFGDTFCRWAWTLVASQGAAMLTGRRALAELLLERYGIVTREQVLAEGIKGASRCSTTRSRTWRRSGCAAAATSSRGMGGAQFALPGAVERLRAVRTDVDVGERGRALVLAAAPAQPYGAALPWPKRDRQERRPARVAGAYVVLVADRPTLYVERGGRGLVTLVDSPRPGRCVGCRPGRRGSQSRCFEALRALSEAVRAGRVGKLALERIDGEPAIASDLAETLVELGFHPGPRRLTLTA